MKIVFINGSLEPGKDGVGDYTRRLAGELIRQGHDCRIVALMDKFLTISFEEIQVSESVKILTLRLPFDGGYNINSKEAQVWIDAFDPDWVSLQYVPFIFNNRGLPFGLSNSLNIIVRDRKFHIMFHELWVGMDTESKLKIKVWGILQRMILQSFLKNLKPDCIHTHTDLYRHKLLELGISVSHLSLFGNISHSESIVINNPVQSKGINIRFVLFGSIHKGAPVLQFINSLILFGKVNNRLIELFFIGKCGIYISEWIRICENAGFIVHITGELPAPEISLLLLNADWGITTTPAPLIEKSGTVAAMLEHGLSVICVSRQWQVRNYIRKIVTPGIITFNSDVAIDYSIASVQHNFNLVSVVSKRLVNSYLNN